MFDYDPEKDSARFNPEVHYRLYISRHGEGVVPICVQDFDYRDYDDGRFLGYESFATEAEAQDAARAARIAALKILGQAI